MGCLLPGSIGLYEKWAALMLNMGLKMFTGWDLSYMNLPDNGQSESCYLCTAQDNVQTTT